ncbi:MAG: FAD-binding oxidoreductase [Burkholderiales bacterium]|nr:FAD-binding oxidoreductase [Burkholderiales bacterium]
MNAVHDHVIVGAGIAGASLAFALAPHSSVLVLEAEEQAGMHSTGRSAAMFMESYGPPQARALTRASRSFLISPPEGFATVPLVRPRGALYAAWQGQEARLEKLLAELQATGVSVQRLDAAATFALVPVLRREGLVGAVWEPQAMDVDVDALHQGFLRGARRAGATHWLGARLASAERIDPGWRLRLEDGRELQARVIVDAAGAWADEVARRCGVAPLSIQPKRRSALAFDAPDGVDARGWPTVSGIGDDWYVKPDAGQLIGSPANADPVPPHDVQPEELDIALAIDAIQRDTTLSIRRPRRTWAGLRSFTPDDEMAIGFDARERSFFWLAGQGGWGIQSSAATSRLAASLLLGQPLPDDLRAQGVDPARIDPARFARR